MPSHVALLRAVNLAGHNMIGMSDLRELAEALGFTEARTLLQSGNLVFSTHSRRSTSRIESALEKAARERLALDTCFFVRTSAEWKTLIDENPFGEEARSDPGHLLAVVLKDAPGADRVSALQDSITGREVVRAKRRYLYAVYPDGVGRSRLTMALIEKKLGTKGTGRNWNTVLKLGALLEPTS
jgi:uncharacterized protein (DUF1697 family)